jgi:hypothetical protein
MQVEQEQQFLEHKSQGTFDMAYLTHRISMFMNADVKAVWKLLQYFGIAYTYKESPELLYVPHLMPKEPSKEFPRESCDDMHVKMKITPNKTKPALETEIVVASARWVDKRVNHFPFKSGAWWISKESETEHHIQLEVKKTDFQLKNSSKVALLVETLHLLLITT